MAPFWMAEREHFQMLKVFLHSLHPKGLLATAASAAAIEQKRSLMSLQIHDVREAPWPA